MPRPGSHQGGVSLRWESVFRRFNRLRGFGPGKMINPSIGAQAGFRTGSNHSTLVSDPIDAQAGSGTGGNGSRLIADPIDEPVSEFAGFALSFFPGLHDGPSAMVNPEYLSDNRTPASELEEKEAGDRETETPAPGRRTEDYLAAGGRILAWFLEGESLAQIGLRVLVATHKLRPDLIGGISYQEISRQAGFGRSAAHNLSVSFSETLNLPQLRLDRSAAARRAYRLSHHRNGQSIHPPAAPPWSIQATPSSRSRPKA